MILIVGAEETELRALGHKARKALNEEALNDGAPKQVIGELKEDKVGNTNSTKKVEEQLRNPKTFEFLTKVCSID